MPPTKSTQAYIATHALYLIPPAAVTIILWLTSVDHVTPLQGLIAYALLYLPWQAYHKWIKGNRDELPLFSMISFMYWVYYVLALFWGDNSTGLATINQDLITQESVTRTLAMVLAGVLALWLGMRSRIGRKLVPRYLPDIDPNPRRWGYLRVLLVIGTIGSMYEDAPYLLGEGGRQILLVCLILVPTAAFAILFRNFLRGGSSKADKVLIGSFVAIRIVAGLSSGWLGPVILLLIMCIAIYITERKSIPRWAVVFVVLYILFLQPGKMAVREKYWYEGEGGSKVERMTYWIDKSVESWVNALADPSGETIRGLGYQSLSRTSLLTPTANVLQLTPSVVPYQYGHLYSYMVVSLVPRFLWPDKPTVSEANQFYQVAYGLTTEENLDRVSISVGFLTEGYINFGWLGVIGVMYFVGVFMDCYQKTFLSENSGLLLRGIGIALLPRFLIIEGQLAQYLAGIAQQVLLTWLILLPLVRRRQHVAAALRGVQAAAGRHMRRQS